MGPALHQLLVQTNRGSQMNILLLLLFPLFLFANRGSSFPYISGDGFRAYCDFIFDETGINFAPEQVNRGSTIFVKTDYMDRFVQHYHPLIKNPYILVTHNSDHPAPGPFPNLLEDPKIIAWFGQNIENYLHPKLHPIPIGLANRMWGHGNPDIVNACRDTTLSKTTLLYLNYSTGTYPAERSLVNHLFSSAPYCRVTSSRNFRDYLLDLAQSQFVLSPRGNGLDSHRLWESLLMGSIPIVKTSALDAVYDGLPVLVVNQWEEITPELLQAKYTEISQTTWAQERLFLPYWYALIDSCKP